MFAQTRAHQHFTHSLCGTDRETVASHQAANSEALQKSLTCPASTHSSRMVHFSGYCIFFPRCHMSHLRSRFSTWDLISLTKSHVHNIRSREMCVKFPYGNFCCIDFYTGFKSASFFVCLFYLFFFVYLFVPVLFRGIIV